jgi:hypothetical protein
MFTPAPVSALFVKRDHVRASRKDVNLFTNCEADSDWKERKWICASKGLYKVLLEVIFGFSGGNLLRGNCRRADKHHSKPN